MKIVVAPDSFKGSISAKDICSTVTIGVKRVFPEAIVKEIPLADGGEGTMENMVHASNGTTKQVDVTGPIGKKIKAEYGLLGDNQTVVVEMAQASGLPLLQDHEKDPMKTTTFGTGELIKHALDDGFRKFIVGLGGSATNDGGTGMLRALGMSFHRKDGTHLPEGGAALIDLDHVDDSKLDPRLKECSIVIASDVTNKLCGPDGASAVFGPQKGATADMVKQLDKALNHFSEVVLTQMDTDMSELVGGGAAGGVGAALITFLDAEIQPGIDIIMEKLNFESDIKDAQLVITGEGRLDSQTLSGKVINGVSKRAQMQGVPVIALCGGLDLETNKFDDLGILSAFTIVPGPCQLEEAMVSASNWIPDRIEAIMRVLKYNLN
ncbi:glycerate kinase [Alkalihalobacillus sp. AL-G]|uniref:glycerate kinase n=1 Tax=Alkalihalobacillus sp. AL-G TaxID=2926399 RepID=UPI00272AFB0C|nr:glycerate kinase [Alkalihalobacillus sp. AL-G]WLD93818.1 glycerate kinase [Alkalihalobacillus sp. AL-G]